MLSLRSLSAFCMKKDVLDCAESISYPFRIGAKVAKQKPVSIKNIGIDPVKVSKKASPMAVFFVLGLFCSWCHGQWQIVFSRFRCYAGSFPGSRSQ
jgi:hypothetical protein